MSLSGPSPKDPAVGAVLSFVFPGLGHLYAGNPGLFVVFLGLESVLFAADFFAPFAAVHVFQTVAAAGAVKGWNQRNVPGSGVDVPAPAGATTRQRPQWQPPPVPPPPAPHPPLGPDEFLAELESAWRDHRAGKVSAREFADRKWRAIGAVAVNGAEDAHALRAAAEELAAAGVLTSEEVTMIEQRVAS